MQISFSNLFKHITLDVPEEKVNLMEEKPQTRLEEVLSNEDYSTLSSFFRGNLSCIIASRAPFGILNCFWTN